LCQGSSAAAAPTFVASIDVPIGKPSHWPEEETRAAIAAVRLALQLVFVAGVWRLGVAGAAGVACLATFGRDRQALGWFSCVLLPATEVAWLTVTRTFIARNSRGNGGTAGAHWLATLKACSRS
jgi:hypothetical protein